MDKYLVGSNLLGLTKNKDTDYVVLDSTIEKIGKRKIDNGVECFYYSPNYLTQLMHFELPYDREILKYMWIYQYDIDIIGQDFPIVWHILDYKDKVKEFLNWVVDNKALNFTKDIYFNDYKMSKLLYHITYMTYILKNNSVQLTKEQKENIQKIHDYEMPLEFLDTLEQEIKSL